MPVKNKVFFGKSLIIVLGFACSIIAFFLGFQEQKADEILEQINQLKTTEQVLTELEREVLFINSGQKYSYDNLSKSRLELSAFASSINSQNNSDTIQKIIAEIGEAVQCFKSNNSVARNAIAAIKRNLKGDITDHEKYVVQDFIFNVQQIVKDQNNTARDKTNVGAGSADVSVKHQSLGAHLKLFKEASFRTNSCAQKVFDNKLREELKGGRKEIAERLSSERKRLLFWKAIGLLLLAGTINQILVLLFKAIRKRQQLADIAVEIEKEVKKKTEELQEANQKLIISFQSLERKQEDIDRILYAFHHDFKTPIRAIGTMTEWMLSDEQNESDKLSLDKINTKAQYLWKLYDSMIRLLDLDKLEEAPAILGLADLKQHYREVLDEKEVKLVVHGDLDSLVVSKKLLFVVLDELVDNSVYHCNNDSTVIEISISDKNNFYEIIVSDNGPGIALADQSRVFSAFQRVEQTKSSDKAGIGLTIANKAVKLLRGKIAYDREYKKGTRFIIILPKP